MNIPTSFLLFFLRLSDYLLFCTLLHKIRGLLAISANLYTSIQDYDYTQLAIWLFVYLTILSFATSPMQTVKAAAWPGNLGTFGAFWLPTASYAARSPTSWAFGLTMAFCAARFPTTA